MGRCNWGLRECIVVVKRQVGTNRGGSPSRGRPQIDGGWDLGLAGMFMLMVAMWLEEGEIGDSRWVWEFGRFSVWFEI